MRVSLTVKGDPVPVELSLQPAATGSAEIQATLSNRPGVFALPARAAQIWQLQPNDLRDPNLARMDETTVNSIHLRSLINPELVLERETQFWELKRFWKTGARQSGTRARIVHPDECRTDSRVRHGCAHHTGDLWTQRAFPGNGVAQCQGRRASRSSPSANPQTVSCMRNTRTSLLSTASARCFSPRCPRKSRNGRASKCWPSAP